MNKQIETLKLAEEALNAMLTHMGMDEDEWTKPTFDQSRKALAAIREALAEPVKQAPVAWRWKNGNEWLNQYTYLDNGAPDCPELCEPLYAAPVQQVDLTVSDLDAIIEKHYDDEMDLKAMILDGIAAFKEKNK